MAILRLFSRRDDLSAARLRAEIDGIFQNVCNRLPAAHRHLCSYLPFDRAGQALVPGMDMRADAASYTLSVELPGVAPEHLQVFVQDNILVVEGEKKAEETAEGTEVLLNERVYGAFRRALRLPEDADAEAVSAVHKNGLLRIVLPRKAQEDTAVRNVTVVQE